MHNAHNGQPITGPWAQGMGQINGFVQHCSISTANTLEILQSCTKSSIRWELKPDLYFVL